MQMWILIQIKMEKIIHWTSRLKKLTSITKRKKQNGHRTQENMFKLISNERDANENKERAFFTFQMA